jgi:serine/threonine protein kinase
MEAVALSYGEDAESDRGVRDTFPFAASVEPPPRLSGRVPVIHSKQYTIVEKVGEGGMGDVYRAYDPMLERDVALKVLKPGLPHLARVRFLQEARHGARMTHPHVAQVYDLGVLPESGLDWFSMEYLVGRDLEDLLWRAHRHEKRLPVRLVLTAFDRVLGALGHAHERGIVHRDVKPGNIFVTRDPGGARFGIKLLDFGVAWDLCNEDGPIDLCGDPRYCAPEQALGDRGLDQRADLYAAGVSLFEALAGRHPFGGVADCSHPAVLLTHCDRPIPSIVDLLPTDWPPATRRAVDVVIAKACAKDPCDRFQDAEAMRLALLDAFASSRASSHVSPRSPG